jgi:methionine-rich copper-binding protein CopC
VRHPLAGTSDASARLSGRVRTGALVVVLGVAALAVSSPAVAHDALIGSDPADGAVLVAAPTQVVLQFSAAQAELGAEVVVTGADGVSWSDGVPVVADTTVTQPLLPGMPNGPYTVTWRSVAGDGHPVTGTLGFTLDAPVPTPTPTPSVAPTASALPSETPTPTSTVVATALADEADADDAGQGVDAWRWVAALAVVGLVTTVVVAVRRRRVSHD